MSDYQWTCPRCGAIRTLEDEGADSKVDPTQVICSPCSHDEWEDERFERPPKPVTEWAGVSH